MTDKYRYEEFTWPEIRDAVAENRVAVLPVGTVEQHGPHLPLVTDVLTATEMSRMAVAAACAGPADLATSRPPPRRARRAAAARQPTARENAP